jgi:N-methylhydantoinase A
VARALGVSKVVAFDMGGTTAKASLSEEGAARVSDGYFVGGYASGQPVMMPVVDVVEVGSGGGSIAALDGQGRLSVGPESAGANPGPVCYQRGGTRPTVTYADLVLGRIGASSFLGGRMPLNREAAVTAIAGQIAQPLGIGVEEAAAAIIAIAVDRMTLAVREVSVASGVDPRECTMVAFGGAGPVHAVEIARELGIPAVLIPNYPSQFSAYGMLVTGVRHDYVRTLM